MFALSCCRCCRVVAIALCNTQSCAFDGADCSINDIFRNVTGFALTIEVRFVDDKAPLFHMITNHFALAQDDEYVVPKGVSTAYFNMSVVIGMQHITDGSHDRPDVIRTGNIFPIWNLLTRRCWCLTICVL